MPTRNRKGASRLRSGRLFGNGSHNNASSPPLPDLTPSFSSGESSSASPPNTLDHRQHRHNNTATTTKDMNRSRALAGSPPRRRRSSRSRGGSVSREFDYNTRRGAEIIREQILGSRRHCSPGAGAGERSMPDYDPSGSGWYDSPPPPTSAQRQVQPAQALQNDGIVEDVNALEDQMRSMRLRVRSGGLDRGGVRYDDIGTERVHDGYDTKEDLRYGEDAYHHRHQPVQRESGRPRSSNERSQASHDSQLVSPSYRPTLHPVGNVGPPDPPALRDDEEVAPYDEEVDLAPFTRREPSYSTAAASRADYASPSSRAEYTEESKLGSPISPVTDGSGSGRMSSYLPQILRSTARAGAEASGYRAGGCSVPTEVNVEDKAYEHASNAGILWQTLVGEQIRFPSRWFDGARTPHLTGDDTIDSSSFGRSWTYVARCRVQGDRDLNRWVRNRSKPGKLLLHVVVRDALGGGGPIQHIAIGCFHPNARGIRQTQEPVRRDENVREVWMAVRKCGDRNAEGGGRWDHRASRWTSRIDAALTQGMPLSEIGTSSPLGDKHTVHNNNVRAVFGDEGPMETLFILENDLYKIMTEAADYQGNGGDLPTVLALLDHFVYNRLR